MSKKWVTDDKKSIKQRKPESEEPLKQRPAGLGPGVAEVLNLQQKVGNQAVQRVLASRSGGDGSFELDDATAGRINQARGGGRALDGALQASMSQTLGHDFSRVRVHDSPESADLNRQVSAKAFTTGQDIFFGQGAYDPGSSGGKELIAHELTHVVQQSSGLVGGGGKMTVNPPGDVYEREADSIAQSVNSAEVQVQRQIEEEEEPVQAQALQRQEDEELVQGQALQRQIEEEEEPVQTQALQRQEELPDEEL